MHYCCRDFFSIAGGLLLLGSIISVGIIIVLWLIIVLEVIAFPGICWVLLLTRTFAGSYHLLGGVVGVIDFPTHAGAYFIPKP